MIKIFTTNKNGKIELTKEEFKNLLDEAYWEGFSSNTTTYTYRSPTGWSPYIWSSTTSRDSIKLNTNMNVTSSIKED